MNLFVDVTPEELNHLAYTIEGCWQQFALVLAPNLFKVTGNIAAIKRDYSAFVLQAKAMLEIWCDQLGAKPQRHLLIGALIQQGLRSQAEAAFGVEVVNEMLKGTRTSGKTD